MCVCKNIYVSMRMSMLKFKFIEKRKHFFYLHISHHCQKFVFLLKSDTLNNDSKDTKLVTSICIIGAINLF